MTVSDRKWEVVSIGRMQLFWKEDKENREVFQSFESEVDRVWDLSSQKRGDKLFNGTVLNWCGIEQVNGGFNITGHFIEYKYFLASKVVKGLRPYIFPVAVSGICFLEDNGEAYAVFARRNKNVTSYPDYLELVPSGSIDLTFASKQGGIDLCSQLRQEIMEETGFLDDQVLEIRPFACVLDKQDQVYDICCRIKLEISRKGLIENFSSSEEYREPELVRSTDLERFVKQHCDQMIPTSVALIEAFRTATERGFFHSESIH